MSDRDQDPNFFTIIRDMRERIKVLETTQNNAIKRNDIRLSDTVVRADSPNDRLCLENLVTHQIVCIGASEVGDPTQAQWSFSGELTPEDEGTISPPYLVDRETIARQIVIAQQCGVAFAEGTVTMCVQFCTADGGSYDQRIALGGTDDFVIKEINVPLVENDIIQVELIDAPTAPTANDISIFVRFGTPTVGISSDDCVV